MTLAALSLALALFVLPVPSRHKMLHRTPALASRGALIAAAAAVAVLAIAAVATPAVGVAIALVGSTLELRRRRAMRRRTRDAEATALQGALDVLVGEMRVGAHPMTAFGVAAREVDGPVALSLHTIAARARIGADVAEGMREAARRSSLPGHWESLAVCWQLAQSRGLAIATLMKTAQCDIVERERYSARIHSDMAGARATAAVLGALPLIGIGLGQLTGADPLDFLLSAGAGGWLLVIGVALACCGLLWSDSITDGVRR